VCVYTYREYLQLCPLAYENTSLQCVGLFAANTWGAGPGSSLMDMLYCTWTSDGLRKREMFCLEQWVHLQYFWKVCVMEEGAVIVQLVYSCGSQSALCEFPKGLQPFLKGSVDAFLWWLLWSLLIYLINGIRFCYKWPWSFFNWHYVYFVWPLLTYSMVQSPSGEANWFAASQEIPCISRNRKVHYRTHH